MKQKYLILSLVSVFMLATYSCQEQVDADIADLQAQIDELQSTLESNNNVVEVLIQDGQLLLVFEDGTNIFTDLPDNPIPYIGENGNWFIGDTDLGAPAVAEIPLIGEDGNWYIDGEDSGISAVATNGVDGDGVNLVTYDQTTGILEITLDSGETYSFELYLEDALKAVKLADLNGEYLLNTIYNGDLPFAKFTYDVNNRLTDASYFTTILNEPVEYMTIHKDLDGAGNITAQTVTEYATKDIATADHDESLPYATNGVAYYDLEEAYDLLFPSGVSGDTPTSGANFFYQAYSDGFEVFYDDTYVYVFNTYDISIVVHMRHVDTEAEFGYTRLNSIDYIWTPEYDYNESEWSSIPEIYAYNTGDVDFDISTGVTSPISSVPVSYYGWANIAGPYTGETDVMTANYVEDYIGTADGNVEFVGTPPNDYRTLFNAYEMYAAGEEMSSTTVAYTYDGADFTIADTEESENLMHVVVEDGLITDLYIREEEEDCDQCRKNNQAPDLSEFIHALHFEYNASGQVEFISLPDDEVTDAIRMTYDTQGNPIEFEVNPSKMEGVAEGESLAFLGLSFAYQEYDADLGSVVEKYAYPDEYITMVSVEYNYGMKNFLNHTFTSMNPLLTMFDNEHAIEQIGWAGHGSALLSEYTKFNDGGYPTEIKTYIQVSAGDILTALDDEDLELDFGVPFNGSVAVTYRLEYTEKQ